MSAALSAAVLRVLVRRPLGGGARHTEVCRWVRDEGLVVHSAAVAGALAGLKRRGLAYSFLDTRILEGNEITRSVWYATLGGLALQQRRERRAS